MEKIKKFFTSVPGIILIFVIAAIPLLIGSIGSARAALTYYSDTYVSQIGMKRIGVTLLDNGSPATKISNRDYLGNDEWDDNTGYLLDRTFLDDNGQPCYPLFGKKYDMYLAVENSYDNSPDMIDTYVRAIIYKYWYTEDANGNKEKDYDLKAKLIDVSVVEGNGWHVVEETDERIVLYYDQVLNKLHPVTPNFTDGITINGDIKNNLVIENDGEGNIYTSYLYDDHKFMLQVDIDAVQTHNAEAAIKSAWGWDVTIAPDGTITEVRN